MITWPISLAPTWWAPRVSGFRKRRCMLIMTRWNLCVVVIDGFADPGRCASGGDGSPIFALKAALEH